MNLAHQICMPRIVSMVIVCMVVTFPAAMQILYGQTESSDPPVAKLPEITPQVQTSTEQTSTAQSSPSDLIIAPPDKPADAPSSASVLPAVAPPVSYAKYKINYWNHALFGRVCCPLRDMVLEVQDPCHCLVQVPVCVPVCCTGVPHISTGRDIFGRFSYTYQWQGGYKVDVVFRPVGDVMVHTWPR